MKIHLNQLPPITGNLEWVGIDTEIFGLKQETMHRPTSGRFASLQICPNDEDVYVITDVNQVPEALQRVQNSIWILMNAKFDITHMRRWADVEQRGKMWDIMILERIMYSGYFPKHHYGLEDLARRHLDIYVDKSLQKSFAEDTGEMTREQIEYAAKDPWLSRKVAIQQKKQVDSTDFKIWKEIENPLIWAVMDYKGFPIDVEGWRQTSAENERRLEESDKYFFEELGFNPRSQGPKGAVAKYVKKEFGLSIKGNKGEIFYNLAQKYPNKSSLVNFCRKILENKQLSSWVSDYGEKFIEGYVEQDPDLGDVIRAEFWTIGADTGRMAASNPPIHGVAVRETLYGEEPPFRKHFRAPEGHKIIRSDYPSQEPRLIAYVSGDETLQELFWKGDDPYIELGKIRLGKEIEKSDPQRTHMKAMFLGAGYGLTPYGMYSKYGIPKKEGNEILNWMFSNFSDLGHYVSNQKRKKKIVETIIGRKFWLNPYGGWHTENNCLNSPIQGSAADMTKIAMINVHKNYSFPSGYPVVMPHHDEIIGIAPDSEAQEVADVIGLEMRKAGEEMTEGKLPFPVKPTIVQHWGEDK